MIIYGTSGAKDLRAQRFHGVECPNCQTPDALEAGAYSRYAHVYWIPLFSIGKSTQTVCTHCGTEFKTKQLPLNMQNRLTDMKSDIKIPIWHFTGLGVIACLIAWGVFQSNQNDADNLVYIQNPQVDDYYEVKTDEGYSLLKVAAVTDDSVALRYNEYVTNKLSGLGDLKEDYRFSQEVMMLSKSDLQDLFEEGEIRDVDR
ncbi:MAG: hypothetical protein AAFN10_11265 [Bacteroidota bacterium]